MSGVAAKVKENNATRQWLSFRLADEVYAVNAMQVEHVVPVSEIANL
jgi:chemotaxis signal transduction protein